MRSDRSAAPAHAAHHAVYRITAPQTLTTRPRPCHSEERRTRPGTTAVAGRPPGLIGTPGVRPCPHVAWWLQPPDPRFSPEAPARRLWRPGAHRPRIPEGARPVQHRWGPG